MFSYAIQNNRREPFVKLFTPIKFTLPSVGGVLFADKILAAKLRLNRKLQNSKFSKGKVNVTWSGGTVQPGGTLWIRQLHEWILPFASLPKNNRNAG